MDSVKRSSLPQPTAHDPVTYWQAYYLCGDGRSRAKGGYICYVLQGSPSNKADYYPGWGRTERDALVNACYWSNQGPWVRVVPLARAPNWAVAQAHGMERERDG